MLTLWCALISVGSLWVVGMPATELLDAPADRKARWTHAPFVGLAILVLVLQNLVYLDVPVRWSAPWIWLAIAVAWVWMARSGRLRLAVGSAPRALPLALGVVFAVQGAGLLGVGARYYVGRAWHDQFNYTAMAQFLADHRFSLSFADVANQPYLYKAIELKTDRIGQSLFHAFVTVSTGTDAKTTFEPVILLLPLLVVPALFAWARTWTSATAALGLAVMGAMLPALAMVHLESFLSQALAVPLLLMWPTVVAELLERPDWKRGVATALVLAAGISVYAEIVVVFAGVLVLMVAADALRTRQPLRALALLVALLAAPAILNPGFLRGSLAVFRRGSAPNVLAGIYPWSFSLEGLSRLWLGDAALARPNWIGVLLGDVSLGLVVIAFFGLLALWLRRRDGASLGMLALAALPLLIRARGGAYGYQFYKMLLSVSPLLPAGVLAAGAEVGRLPVASRGRGAVAAAGVVLAAAACVTTLDMTWRTGRGRTEEVIGRGGAHKLLAPASRRVQGMLESLRGEDLIVAWFDDFFGGNYLNAWLAYFARHNWVWVLNPRLSDMDLGPLTGSDAGIVRARADALLLLPDRPPVALFAPGARRVWEAGPYALWRLAGRDWVFVAEVASPNGVEGAAPHRWFWVGDRDLALTVIAGRSGTLKLGAVITAGPSLPGTPVRHLRIATDGGYERASAVVLEGAPTAVSWSIPVAAGRTRVTIRGLDRPSAMSLPNGDTRTLLFGMDGLKIVMLH